MRLCNVPILTLNLLGVSTLAAQAPRDLITRAVAAMGGEAALLHRAGRFSFIGTLFLAADQLISLLHALFGDARGRVEREGLLELGDGSVEIAVVSFFLAFVSLQSLRYSYWGIRAGLPEVFARTAAQLERKHEAHPWLREHGDLLRGWLRSVQTSVSTATGTLS